MSSEGIQFDEDSMSNASRQQASQNASGSQPAMIRWLMDKGIAKSPAMAQGILIGVIVVFFILTYVIVS